MSPDLDQRLREKPRLVIRRTPSSQILTQVQAGKKFILVEDNFDPLHIPPAYILIDLRYRGESFRTLVPQNLLFYLANPGEGDLDSALDEIGDFYKEVQDFEDDLLEESRSSVQGPDWAVTSRHAYQTYLINKLAKGKSEGGDGEDGKRENADVPEFNPEALKTLDLDDDYVSRRVKAMAALALGKNAEQVRSYDLGEVLRHVTINERRVESLTREEFDKITCWAGSHYEIRDEYRNNSDVEYQIDRRHDTSHKVGEKITHRQDVTVFDAKIGELEEEIETYRSGKHHTGRHDQMLLRTYANLAYIAREDPQKQLEIKPTIIDANKGNNDKEEKQER